MNSGLKIKRDHRPDGKRNCPSCGAAVTEEDILCVQCGYNRQSGERIIVANKKNKMLLPTLAVAVVLVAAMTFNKKCTAATNHPSIPEAQSSTNAVSTISTNQIAPTPDLSGMAAQQKKLLSKQLDDKYPLYESGAEAALRLSNGLVKRGVFIVSDGTHVRLKLPTGEKIEVPLTSLDTMSRIRCDRPSRQQFIEAQVNLQAQQRMAP